MSTPTAVQLQPGRVYRTRDLAPWTRNPPRLAKALVAKGLLTPLAHGLFVHPRASRFGPVPPTDSELMTAYLCGSPFVVTGSARWNSLGLGSTGVDVTTLVYNTKRSGEFKLGGRRYRLRRTAFPENPPPEWFVIDLLEHADEAGADSATLVTHLGRALEDGVFNPAVLTAMAARYGSKLTQRRLKPLLAADAK